MASPRITRLPVLLLAFSPAFLNAADRPPRPKHPLPSKPADWKPVQHESYVAYWTLEAGWNTRLEIRNNVPWRDLSVTPVLRTAAGAESPLPAVTISPNEIKELNLRLLALYAAPDLLDKPNSFGSVALRFNSNDAENVFSSTIVERTGSPIAFHFDGEHTADQTQMASTVESIWWLPTSTATDYLLVSNSSNQPLNARVVLTDFGGGSTKLDLGLGPAQTRRVDIRELTTRAHLQGAQGGVTISTEAGVGTLEVSQIVFDDPTGFAVTMKTFETDPSEKPELHTIHAPMMALASPDPALSFPAGTVLNPQVFLRNTSAAPLELSGTMNWRSADTSGLFAMPLLTLNRGELRVLHLSDYQKNGQIPADAHWSTVSFTYRGRSGDLVPIASSYDSSGKYGLQTPFSEGMAAQWAGSMWHVDSTRDTLITATNGGDKPTHAAVVLYYDAGQHRYQLQQLLNPGQQLWVDVGQIIQGQLADKDGNTIPAATSMGSYALMDLDHGAGTIYEGKLVLDKAYGRGYYGCATCCGHDKTTGITWSPNPYTAAIGNGTWNTLFAYNMCYAGWDDVTPYGTGWNSTNTAVASVASEYTNLVGAGGASGFTNSINLDTNNPRTNCAAAPFTVQNQSITAKPVVSFTSTPPSGVAVATAGSLGAHEIYMSAKCDPQGQVNPTFNWSIEAGSGEVSTDGGGSTMGFIGQQQSTTPGDVLIGLSCTDTNTGLTSATIYTMLTSQRPSGLAIVAPDTTASNNCPSGQCGPLRQYKYQVTDQFGTAIHNQALDFWDWMHTNATNTCNLQSYRVTCNHNGVASDFQTGSCYASGGQTDSTGQFNEVLSLCAPACWNSAQSSCSNTCSTSTTQTWVVNGYNIPKSLTYACSSVSVQ